MSTLAPPKMSDFTQYNIVVLGDSISGKNYGDWQTGLKTSYNHKVITIINLAVDGRKLGGSGSTILNTDLSIAINEIISGANNILILGGGTNDICSMVNEGRSVTDIHNDMVSIIEDAKISGFNHVVRLFIIDREQPACSAVSGGYFISTRTALHSLDVSYCTANEIPMVRCDLDPFIGVSGQASVSTYFLQGADPIGKVHLNNTNGKTVLQGLIKTQLDTIIL